MSRTSPFPSGRRLVRVCAAFLAALPAPALPEEDILFLSEADDRRIAVFRIDPASGIPERTGALATSGEPGALAWDGRRLRLFACMRSTGRLAAFAVDRESGALRLVNEVAGGPDPAHTIVDRSGRHLLTAYYVAGKVTVHGIDAEGRLSARPRQTFPTAGKAHAVELDADNRHAWVPHTGANAVFQFAYEPAAGRLRPLDPDRVNRPPGTGPRHAARHPGLPVLYCNDEQGSSVTRYAVDEGGRLTAAESVSTLPPDHEGGNSTARMQLGPGSRFLYAANRGHDSIAVFRVGEREGRLVPVGRYPTEATPRSFTITPDGRHLIAAGQASGRLAVHRIGPGGRLERTATVAVGGRPWWVLAVRLPSTGGAGPTD